MENRGAESSTGRRLGGAVRVVGGILIIVLWPCGWFIWGALSLMGTLMANDAGQAGATAHTTLILGMLGGQVLAGASGIPLGLSLFTAARRRLLLWTFGWTLLAGLIAQGLAIYAFFLGLSPS